MVFRGHYPITHVAIYDMLKWGFNVPVFTIAFYGLKPEDFTWIADGKWGPNMDLSGGAKIVRALERRGLDPNRYCPSLFAIEYAKTEYLREHTPRVYTRFKTGDQLYSW